MKNTSVWMAVLTFTAVVFAAILLSSGDRPAQAAMINSLPNFTLLTSGGGGDESLIVIDKVKGKMIIYGFKANELVPLASGPAR
jgi:hypothetical protein